MGSVKLNDMEQLEHPLEKYFMGKWILEEDVFPIPATELHVVKPLRRSKRINNTKDTNHTTTIKSSNVLSISTRNQEQRRNVGLGIAATERKRGPHIKESDSKKIISKENKKLIESVYDGKICYNATGEENKENSVTTRKHSRKKSVLRRAIVVLDKLCDDKINQKTTRSRKPDMLEDQMNAVIIESSKKIDININTNFMDSGRRKASIKNKKDNLLDSVKKLETIKGNKDHVLANKSETESKQKGTKNTSRGKRGRKQGKAVNQVKYESYRTENYVDSEEENQNVKICVKDKQENVRETQKRKRKAPVILDNSDDENVRETQKRKRKASVILDNTDDDFFVGENQKKRRISVMFDNYDDENDTSWDAPSMKKKAQPKVEKEKTVGVKSYKPPKIVGSTKNNTKKDTNKDETQTKTDTNKAQQFKKNTSKSEAQQSKRGTNKAESQQSTKSTNKVDTKKKSKCKVPDSHLENLRPEECEVTAKRGTLKYLQQREKFVAATANEAQVDQDFFSAKSGFTKKKSKVKVNQLLLAGALDDSLTITTPKSKKAGEDNSLVTPRTTLMGQLGEYTPVSDAITPSTSTPATENRRDALMVMYHQGKPRGIRRALQKSQSSFSAVPAQPPKHTTSLEIPDSLFDQNTSICDSSYDDYFEDIIDVPLPPW